MNNSKICEPARENASNAILYRLRELREDVLGLREFADRRLAPIIIPQPPAPTTGIGRNDIVSVAMPPLFDEMACLIADINVAIRDIRSTINSTEV